MKGKYDVYILEAGNQFRVRPAVWAGKAGETCFFKNTTPYSVYVTIDAPLAAGGPVTLTLGPNDAKGKDKNDQKSVVLAACDGGAYKYKVEVDVRGKVPAVGESEPVIIIDP